MKKHRKQFKKNNADARPSAKDLFPTGTHPVFGHPSRKIKIFMNIPGFLVSLIALFCLMFPVKAFAFGLGQLLNDAAKTLEQHMIPNGSKNPVKSGKKAEEPHSPQAHETAPVRQALKAKVHEVFIGQSGNVLSGSQVLVSEDGAHVATGKRKGSRQVMEVDGVDGPVFDEVIPFKQQFHSRGGRYAYVGRRGTKFIGVVHATKSTHCPWQPQSGPGAESQFPEIVPFQRLRIPSGLSGLHR